MPKLLILILSVLAISASAQTPQSAPNFNGRPVIKVSSKVLEKTAIKKVKPVMPVGVRATGVVLVRVWIDALEGKVIEAKAVSGPELSRDAAVQAAKQWEFKPAEITAAPIKAQGVLVFRFAT
jgi:hypothetical protein